MNAKEVEFLDKCPAWARKLGVETLNVWQIIEYCLPFEKSERFDYLDWEVDERVHLTADEAVVARRVLQAWDDMAKVDFHCNSCGLTSSDSKHCKFCEPL